MSLWFLILLSSRLVDGGCVCGREEQFCSFGSDELDVLEDCSATTLSWASNFCRHQMAVSLQLFEDARVRIAGAR